MSTARVRGAIASRQPYRVTTPDYSQPDHSKYHYKSEEGASGILLDGLAPQVVRCHIVAPSAVIEAVGSTHSVQPNRPSTFSCSSKLTCEAYITQRCLTHTPRLYTLDSRITRIDCTSCTTCILSLPH